MKITKQEYKKFSIRTEQYVSGEGKIRFQSFPESSQRRKSLYIINNFRTGNFSNFQDSINYVKNFINKF
jgi:hypothetical protein